MDGRYCRIYSYHSLSQFICCFNAYITTQILSSFVSLQTTQWTNDWQIDKRKSYGSCDENGWYYAPSVGKLEEDMSKGTASGSASTLSIIRRRRYTRSRICVSYTIRETINSQMKLLNDTHTMLESTLYCRQQECSAFKDYERARISRCKTGYFRINSQISSYMLSIKDYREKLIKLSVFLTEISEIESEYAERIRHVGSSLRYQRGMKKTVRDIFPTDSSREGDELNGFSIRIPEAIEEVDEEDEIPAQDGRDLSEHVQLKVGRNTEFSDGGDDRDSSNFPTHRRQLADSQTSSSSSSSSKSPFTPPSAACVTQFFEKVGASHELIGEHHRNIADLLNMELIADVNGCLAGISDTYSRSKVAWKDRRETYRVFEDAVKTAFRGVDVSYQYSCASLISEISRVKAELEIRMSGRGQNTAVESELTTSTIHNSVQRKDLWLEVRRYHQAIGDVEHGMSALLNFLEEIQAVWNHIMIKVKAVFLAVTQQFSNAQVSSWKSSSEVLQETVQELLGLEFMDEEFLNHSSDNARADVSTMEVLLHYHGDKQAPQRRDEWDQFITLPVAPSSNCIAMKGYLLYMPTTHCSKPDHAQFPNPEKKLHDQVVAPVENRDDTFIGQKTFWVIIKAVSNYCHSYYNKINTLQPHFSRHLHTQAITQDSFLHLFEVTDDDRDLANIHGRHDLRNFCSLRDEDVDLSDKSPFVSIDIKDSVTTPIFIPPERVLMKFHQNHFSGKSDHQHLHHHQGKHKHNAIYVCRHTNPPKRKNIRLIGDFCLWTPTKECSVKWMMALGDPLSAKNTQNDTGNEVRNNELQFTDPTSIEDHAESSTSLENSVLALNVEEDEINRMLALEAAEELEEEERRRNQEFEELFNSTLTEEEKEENRRTQEEEEEVERLLALEAAEDTEVAASSKEVDDACKIDAGEESATPESVRVRRSLVEGVSDFVCSR